MDKQGYSAFPHPRRAPPLLIKIALILLVVTHSSSAADSTIKPVTEPADFNQWVKSLASKTVDKVLDSEFQDDAGIWKTCPVEFGVESDCMLGGNVQETVRLGTVCRWKDTPQLVMNRYPDITYKPQIDIPSIQPGRNLLVEAQLSAISTTEIMPLPLYGSPVAPGPSTNSGDKGPPGYGGPPPPADPGVVCGVVFLVAVLRKPPMPSPPSGSANPPPVKEFVAEQTKWSGCTATCGDAVQSAMFYCWSLSKKQLVPIGRCKSTEEFNNAQFWFNPRYELLNLDTMTAVKLTRPCRNVKECGELYFRVGAFGTCSARCGGGVLKRHVVCIERGVESPDSNCESTGLVKPKDTQPCNTFSCKAPFYVSQGWSGCSSTEGSFCGGERTRVVTCMMQGEGTLVQAVNDSLCKQHSIERPLEKAACPKCKQCDGVKCNEPNGSCFSGVCKCQETWRGATCEFQLKEACSGTIDGKGLCCQSDMVSSTGECCKPGSVLDASGKCCNSGKLDACGECDGQGKMVDALGRCCRGEDARLDHGNQCCESGEIDECGACDGDDTSCAIAAKIELKSSRLSTLNDDQKRELVQIFLADVTSLPMLRIKVTTVRLKSTMVKRRLHQADTFDVDFTLLPASSLQFPVTAPPTQIMFSADGLVRRLGEVLHGSFTPTDDSSNGFQLTNFAQVLREGVCGNSVCEYGEELSLDDLVLSTEQQLRNGKCFADCPNVDRECTVGTTILGDPNLPCGGVGTCISSWGECRCYDGYTGIGCNDCSEGYALTSSLLCIKAFTPATIYNAIPIEANNTSPSPDADRSNFNFTDIVGKSPEVSAISGVHIVNKKPSDNPGRTITLAVCIPVLVLSVLGLMLVYVLHKRQSRGVPVDPPVVAAFPPLDEPPSPGRTRSRTNSFYLNPPPLHYVSPSLPHPGYD